ncbi:MAG: hypothetical protein KAX49_13775 [Halanaerobiales bacterium]|nr:hypothetical protein [Halanaerobiales bacterium]
MKIHAIICPECRDTVYSRAHHDMRYCSCKTVAIDGGFHYAKVTFKTTPPESLFLELDVTEKQLFGDYNTNENKYGLIKGEKHEKK